MNNIIRGLYVYLQWRAASTDNLRRFDLAYYIVYNTDCPLNHYTDFIDKYSVEI